MADLRYGRALKRAIRRCVEMDKIAPLVEKDKERLWDSLGCGDTVWIGIEGTTPNLYMMIDGEEVWLDYTQIPKIRDFLNEHFPPPCKARNPETQWYEAKHA